MSNGASSAASLAEKLGKYAYSPSPSPRKHIGVQQDPATPTRPERAGTSTTTPRRRSARKTTSQSPYFERQLDDGEDDGEELVKMEDEPPTPSKTLKRRDDGSLDKFGWKKPRRFAEPEKYAHLAPLVDCLEMNLNLIFCGINPGQRSSRVGHHFAHPTNKFWRALHLSGLTPRLLTPQEDVTLPKEYGYGLTNLVTRPTAEQAELSAHEMRVAVGPLVSKFVALRPRVVCFVGKKIWDIFAGVVGKTARDRERASTAKSRKRAKQKGEEVKGEAGSTAKITLFTLEDGVVKSEIGGDETRQADGGGLNESRVEPSSAADTVDTVDTATNDHSTAPPSEDSGTHSRRKTPDTNRKPAFNFGSPQRLRLVLPPSSDASWTYTYFWVVPSTSGLERTSLADVGGYFSGLKDFVACLEAGDASGAGPNDYIDFALAEVESVVASM